MVIVTLLQDAPNLPSYRKQQFFFKKNEHLYLDMIENKYKVSSSTPYVYDSLLDKQSPTYSPPSRLTDSNTLNKKEKKTDATSAPEYESILKDYSHSDSAQIHAFNVGQETDELIDRIFELYDKYKVLRDGLPYEQRKDKKALIDAINKQVLVDKDKKDLLIKKLDVLKACYPAASIPTIPSDADVDYIEKVHANVLEKVYAAASVEDYKSAIKYSKYVFLAMEAVLSYAGIESSGYTDFHMEKVNTYERLLIELGAHNQLRKLYDIPPIIKVIGFFILNNIIFFGVKFAIKMDPSNGEFLNTVSGIVGTMLTKKAVQTSSPDTQSKMKGPR